MTEDHEKAGYEYEKGRQKLLDERAAVKRAADKEAKRAFKEKAKDQGSSMMWTGMKMLLAAGAIWLASFFIISVLPWDSGLLNNELIGSCCVLLGLVLIPGSLALRGAFKFLGGCACPELFTDSIEDQE